MHPATTPAADTLTTRDHRTSHPGRPQRHATRRRLLAAALAVPLVIDTGAAFPDRDLIVFLAFSVILATLLIQGLTLPPLIHLLGVDDSDEQLERELDLEDSRLEI